MIVGIDLGTTNSLVGFWQNGSITLVPNALGHLLTPSAVGLGDGGDILVGLPARERLTTHPTLTAAAFKRYMGTERLLFVGEKGFRAEELSALVFAHSNPMPRRFWASASRKPSSPFPPISAMRSARRQKRRGSLPASRSIGC